MRTMLTIVSTLLMMYAAVPQRVHSQVRATATIKVTVIPSVSLELLKSSAITTKEDSSPLTINVRGTGNILVVVDSKGVKSSNIHQLTTEKPLRLTIPSSSQTSKTSIIYLSS